MKTNLYVLGRDINGELEYIDLWVGYGFSD
jgi:hypothetical protein